MSLAATIPTHKMRGSRRAGCFLLLVVLIVQEREMVDPVGDETSLLATVAVVKKDGVRM